MPSDWDPGFKLMRIVGYAVVAAVLCGGVSLGWLFFG